MEKAEDTQVEEACQNVDVDSDIYKADEFRMYCYKILPCAKRHSHDWTVCPFSHPGEKAKRRDLRQFDYMGIACPAKKKTDECPKGDLCPFAHNVFEYWMHPTRYRTQMCNDGLNCKRKICFFAHAPEQLRSPAGQTENVPAEAQPFGFDSDIDSQALAAIRYSSPDMEQPVTPPQIPISQLGQATPFFKQRSNHQSFESDRSALAGSLFNNGSSISSIGAADPVAVNCQQQSSLYKLSANNLGQHDVAALLQLLGGQDSNEAANLGLDQQTIAKIIAQSAPQPAAPLDDMQGVMLAMQNLQLDQRLRDQQMEQYMQSLNRHQQLPSSSSRDGLGRASFDAGMIGGHGSLGAVDAQANARRYSCDFGQQNLQAAIMQNKLSVEGLGLDQRHAARRNSVRRNAPDMGRTGMLPLFNLQHQDQTVHEHTVSTNGIGQFQADSSQFAPGAFADIIGASNEQATNQFSQLQDQQTSANDWMVLQNLQASRRASMDSYNIQQQQQQQQVQGNQFKANNRFSMDIAASQLDNKQRDALVGLTQSLTSNQISQLIGNTSQPVQFNSKLFQ